jgi:predicted nucleic acid-binding protein
VILTDTGPVVALLDRRDPRHELCFSTAIALDGEVLVTTWASFTESMHLLGKKGGFAFQSLLWEMHGHGDLVTLDLTQAQVQRTAELMSAFRDAPMDLADATLLAIAESHGFRTIFTLDQGFRFFTLADGSVLEIIPDLPNN